MEFRCPNNDCQQAFKYSMQQKCCLYSKKCNETPPEESIVKQEDHFMCLKCSTTVKRQSRHRHRKHCKNTFLKRKKNLFMRHVEKSLIFSPNLMNTKGKKQFYFTCNNCQKHFKRKDFFHTWIFFSTHNLTKKRFFSQGYKMYINISSFNGYLIQ